MSASTDPQTTYDSVADEMATTSPTKLSKMFGMPCLKNEYSKAFAGYHRGSMVFKLTNPEHAEALALAGAHLFDPTDANRPMKEWVVVPFEHASKWLALAQAAFRYADKTQK